MIRSIIMASALGAGLMLAGCVDSGTPPYPPPPPPLAETLPLPPLTPHVLTWQPGAWDWNGRDYQWAAGRYVDKADHGGLWQVGYWAKTPDGWRWVPPHWS